MKDSQVQIIFEHYNDSCQANQARVKQRDRLFAYILIVSVLFLFQIYSPANAQVIIAEYISNKLGLTSTLDIAFLCSVLWFILLALLVRYLQTLIAIERGYDYIHKIEAEIASKLKSKVFSREGQSYLDEYPLFLDWAFRLFNTIFPIVLTVIITAKIIPEIPTSRTNINFLHIVDAIIYLMIMVSFIIYFVSMKKNSEKQKAQQTTS